MVGWGCSRRGPTRPDRPESDIFRAPWPAAPLLPVPLSNMKGKMLMESYDVLVLITFGFTRAGPGRGGGATSGTLAGALRAPRPAPPPSGAGEPGERPYPPRSLPWPALVRTGLASAAALSRYISIIFSLLARSRVRVGRLMGQRGCDDVWIGRGRAGPSAAPWRAGFWTPATAPLAPTRCILRRHLQPKSPGAS